MRQEVIGLLLKQPFEEVMDMALRHGIQPYYDAKRSDFYCKYWIDTSEVTTANQKTIKLAVAYAILEATVDGRV